MNKSLFTLELVKELKERIKKGEVREFSKKKFAELIYSKYPEVYSSVEDARVFIRIVTGASGEKHRKNIKQLTTWN